LGPFRELDYTETRTFQVSEFSYPKEKIKILLLEGIHNAAVEQFHASDYVQVELLSDALNEAELVEKLPGVHMLGIRSKTKITRKALEAADTLLAVGCFCIGTNQVDLSAAAQNGVAVFNAPFSNTRSVAELTMALVVMLARGIPAKNMLLHKGKWNKSATGSHEVRGKTLGIVGYGHIGPQVGILAEAFGMKVLFFDILTGLPLGMAQATTSLDELLSQADHVTLHVPETPDTQNMIGAAELAKMKPESTIINLSRGTVVDIEALSGALASGHIAGAAVDVFPREPKSNDEAFSNPLQGHDNVVLTPHIGGSTLEAQVNIGKEVANSLVRYCDSGSSTGAVNFPGVELPIMQDTHRVLNIHRNVPGVLGEINNIIAEMGVNISGQYLGTNADIGYLIMDVGENISREVKRGIEALDANLKTRLLF
jgi:D-3-phosphoglycerate dehydrogenase